MNISEPIVRPDITFAWEKSDIEEKVRKTLEGTNTLVIIGYSLPYFNREIDHKSLRERFLTLYGAIQIKKLVDNKIEMISGTDLFYIPDDMPR
jgi:hypothetical protein